MTMKEQKRLEQKFRDRLEGSDVNTLEAFLIIFEEERKRINVIEAVIREQIIIARLTKSKSIKINELPAVKEAEPRNITMEIKEYKKPNPQQEEERFNRS